MEKEVVEVLPLDIKARIDKGEQLNLIDVRENDEVAAGMIPGARHIRLAELPDRLHELNPDDEVICVCRSGKRSGRACEYLMSQGFQNVRSLRGGMLAWEGNGQA